MYCKDFSIYSPSNNHSMSLYDLFTSLWVIVRPVAFKLCVLQTLLRKCILSYVDLSQKMQFHLQCRTTSIIKQVLLIGVVHLSDACESHQPLTVNILCIISKKAVILWRFLQFWNEIKYWVMIAILCVFHQIKEKYVFVHFHF